ncbi:Calcineurin-like phosphoesterase [Aphelenchoides bicaudatus]|nr:Calcineurin-like phosphoesterase [Aphelenchoides bicaudatus]
MIAVDKRSSDPHVLWEEYWSKERVHRPYENKLSLGEPVNPEFVRIVCISDTHGQLDKVVNRIPDGDILVHCGDFTNNGELEEIQKFDATIGQLPHKNKIVIAGNHELGFDDTENLELRQRKSRGLGTPKGYKHLKNCTILHDKAVEIYGLKIYGSSWHPLEGYSFSCTRGNELASKWSKIPQRHRRFVDSYTSAWSYGYFQRWSTLGMCRVIERRRTKNSSEITRVWTRS